MAPADCLGGSSPLQANARAARPTVTFGVLALNAEPLIEPCVRALLPFAHQIIVVEGASPHAAASASRAGHSVDGTLETLRRLERELGHVLTVITAEDHGHPLGFWPGEKDEQSRAYAERATGEVLWQVDADEFYLPDDVERVLGMLREDPELMGLAFDWWNFWGSFDALVDGWYYRENMEKLGGNRRVFRWGRGYRYTSHRPPTVVDADGRDVARQGRFLWAADTRALGIRCFHYGMVFDHQARQKAAYYGALPATRAAADYAAWYAHAWQRLQRPYGVLHGTREPSWLSRFAGKHPAVIDALRASNSHLLSADERARGTTVDGWLSSVWYPRGAQLLARAYRCRSPLRRLRGIVARRQRS